jgi:hypothetical protein
LQAFYKGGLSDVPAKPAFSFTYEDQATYALTTTTTLMTAPCAIRVTVGTSFTAVILAALFHSLAKGNDAQARFTSTLHRSHGSHDFVLKLFFR